MRIFVSDAGNLDRRQWCIDHDVGLLMSPEYGTPCHDPAASVMIDNGAFGAWKRGEKWNEKAFYDFLQRMQAAEAPIYGVACPDIVCGGLDSLARSADHLSMLDGFPAYLVVQDGMHPSDVQDHIGGYIGIFVGGSLQWKWRTMSTWVQFAHRNGLLCHAGRVGNVRGYMAAANLGVDSVDGSNLMRHNRLDEIERYRELEAQQARILKKEEWLLSVGAAVCECRIGEDGAE